MPASQTPASQHEISQQPYEEIRNTLSMSTRQLGGPPATAPLLDGLGLGGALAGLMGGAAMTSVAGLLAEAYGYDGWFQQQVFTQEPYASKGSTPDTLNSTDNIYQELLLLTTSKTDQGYAATFDIGIDPSTVGTGESGGPGGPGSPPPGAPPGRATLTPAGPTQTP
jgi:hypothetical protein